MWPNKPWELVANGSGGRGALWSVESGSTLSPHCWLGVVSQYSVRVSRNAFTLVGPSELVQRQEYLDTTIAKNIPNIFNLIGRRSKRL